MNEIKLEIGQTIDEIVFGNFKDRRGNAAKIDITSPVNFEIETPEAFTLTPGEVTDSSAKLALVHTGSDEVRAKLTFSADGDTDSGEDSPIMIDVMIVVDSPNAVTGDTTNTAPHD